MNGRLYDPVLGRMLSPDNFIQTPGFTQNFNRYSYVLNNPLKYTDPSGELYVWDDIIVGGVGFLAGYLQHGISTGNWGGDALKAGAIGAGTALLGYYTGGGGLYLAGNGMLGASFTQMIGGMNYAAGFAINSVVNNFIPPITMGNQDAGVSISPSITPSGLRFSATYYANIGDVNLSFGGNTGGDVYYGVSVYDRANNAHYAWYRTDFAGEMQQGLQVLVLVKETSR